MHFLNEVILKRIIGRLENVMDAVIVFESFIHDFDI